MYKFFIFILIFFSLHIQAQNAHGGIQDESIIKKVQNHYHLTDRDMSGMILKQKSTSKQNGVTHHYFNQTINGIEIHNAILNIHILPNGKLFHHASRFISNAHSKINSKSIVLNGNDALKKALQFLNKKEIELNILEQDNYKIRFKKNEYVLSDIFVQLKYWENKKNELILTWDIGLEMTDGLHAWSFKINAEDGYIEEQIDMMNHCSFNIENKINHTCNSSKEYHSINDFNPDSYHVFPYHVESPSHGNSATIINPANTISSPFGWHDTDGEIGAENNITKGNNCHVFSDRDGDLATSFDEPNGGSDLDFNFSFNPDDEPISYQEFSAVQAFYMCNVVHDISYLYGFDEAHGNYQQTNYNVTEGEGDYINVLCQFRGDLPAEGTGQTDNRNNANFFAGFQDGDKGRLRTYLWTNAAVEASRLTVISPANIAGGYISGIAQFGPQLSNVPVEGTLNVADPILGCDGINNDLQGKIAVLERGNCNLSEKVFRAQQQGAIAAIICNNEDEVFEMLGGDFAALITIPSVVIKKSDCENILTAINNGVVVSLQEAILSGPNELDASLDNGVVSHEYAHGISRRLTGGKSTTSCLDNLEEMGEGWSDFFALALTTTEGMNGGIPRGIGTYLTREPNDGKGIRTYPYSTDMSINPSTYDSIQTASIPHGVGMVWNSMLWDLYWAMVEEHGFNNDIYYGNGGNNMCIQLVMDGMKLQPCEPGFVDARNAILAADIANYNGLNQCLIWEVFARRGLGYSATQGSSNSVSDGIEAFDITPSCEPIINPTEEFSVNIYPNPIGSQNYFNLDITSPTLDKEIKIYLYELDGKKINEFSFFKNSLIQNFIIPLNKKYKSGYYLLQIIDGDNKSTQKILITNE